jgi:hypothetical protein
MPSEPMEFMLYDGGGRAVAYCEDGRHLYSFNGFPLAYLDGNSVYAFAGQHLGWDRGWVRDHDGACVFFTDAAAGPLLPTRQSPPPPKAAKQAPQKPAYQLPKPLRAVDVPGWSLRSGKQFFQPIR